MPADTPSPTICPECGKPLPTGAPRGLCPACLLKRGLETNTVGFTEDSAGPRRAAWTPPAPDAVAERFPDLDIIRLIGRGGMGAVYEARQKSLDRTVALKILPPEIAADPAFADRFAREAQAMARLNHPNIVAIYDFGKRGAAEPAVLTPDPQPLTPPWFYFLMEYVDGLSLRGLLDAGHIQPKEALAIVPQICDALQYAHDQGIVHRDIKPENILLNKQGQVKIADFGLAKLVGAQSDEGALARVGTPHYMAPEQTQHPDEVDHRADIYSLGVVFYQMLTGELPHGNVEPPSRRVQIDVRLDEIVLRAMETDPERRYQQASEVRTELETVAQTARGSAARARAVDARAAGLGPPAAANTASIRPLLYSVGTHASILLVVLGFYVIIVPRLNGVFSDFRVAVPPVTWLVLSLSSLLVKGWFLAAPAAFVLLAADVAVCTLLQRSSGLRRTWSLAVSLALLATLVVGAWGLVTPLQHLVQATPRRAALPASGASATVSAAPTPAEQPPVVVGTFPQSGERGVAPGLVELRVTFSKPMMDGWWSWSEAWLGSTPELFGKPNYDGDRRTCTVSARLEPGRTYAFWLNSEQHHNFQDTAGQAAVPYLLIFQTRSGPAAGPASGTRP